MSVARRVVALAAALFAAGCGPQRMAAVIEPVHRFGTVEPGTVVEHTFEIANTGEKPLDLLRVTPTCGCTLATPVEKTIWPGHSGRIQVKLDTTALAGSQSKGVRVRTSDPLVPEVDLQLEGYVAEDVEAKPSALLLGRGGPADFPVGVARVIVLNPGVSVTRVKSQYGQLDIDWKPMTGAARGVEMVVRPKINGVTGLFSDRILVSTTSTRQPLVRIPVMGSIEAWAVRTSRVRSRAAAP